MVREQPAVAQLVDRRRVDGDEQLGDVARLRERQHADVDPLEVEQHPREDLRLGRVGQQARLELRWILLLVARAGPAAEEIAREQRAAVERVDDEILRIRQGAPGWTPQEEM